MFGLLLESAPRTRPQNPGWTSASIAIHVILVSAGVLATTRVATSAPARPKVVPLLVYQELRPVNAPRQPSGDGLRVNPVGELRIPTIPLPTVALPSAPVVIASEPFAAELARGGTVRTGPATGVPDGGVYHLAFVHRAVVARQNNPALSYPGALRAAGVEGDVLVRFVVDTIGRVEAGSIEIVREAHPLFGRAVAEWLGRNRYYPAQVHGRPVRQLVEQRISFSLQASR